MSGTEHEHAAANAFARFFTNFGLPAMLTIMTVLIGTVWSDLKSGQADAAHKLEQAMAASQEQAVQLQQTRSDVTSLRVELTSGVMWRLQKLEEKQEALQRAVSR